MHKMRYVRNLIVIIVVAITSLLAVGHATPAPDAVTYEAASDPYEPNDSFSTATMISYPAYLIYDITAIDPAGDLDYFRFFGQAGDVTSFYLYEDSPLEAVLTLYDENLQVLAEDNDATGNQDGVASFVYELPEKGNYYLRIKDNRHPTAGGEDYVYSFSLHLDETGEPNDDFDLATPISYGQRMRGFLESLFGPDVDTYVFAGQQGDVISMSLYPDGPLEDELNLCFYDPDLAEITCVNNLKDYELPMDGSYYLQVTGNHPGNYTLYLWLAAPADAFEPNDERTQAADIELGETLNAALEDHDGVPFYEDVDFFQFPATAGQPLLVTADSELYGGQVDPELMIQDDSGAEIAYAEAYSTQTELPFTVPADGMYYIRVSATCTEGGGSCQGGYQVSLKKMNEAPVAKVDNYTHFASTTLDVSAPGVLANDSDADGDSLTAVLISDVQNGTLSLQDSGAFSYMPNARFFGIDAFVYQANDGELNSELTSVFIEVKPPQLFLPVTFGG